MYLHKMENGNVFGALSQIVRKLMINFNFREEAKQLQSRKELAVVRSY